MAVWDITQPHDIACDIGDPAQIERAAAATLDQQGPPGEVTVTAGIGHGGLLVDADPADWDRVMGVNAGECGWPCAPSPRRWAGTAAPSSW